MGNLIIDVIFLFLVIHIFKGGQTHEKLVEYRNKKQDLSDEEKIQMQGNIFGIFIAEAAMYGFFFWLGCQAMKLFK